MSKMIVVGISDLNIAKGDEALITYALGSCVGICLYDNIKKIAGMSHIMLPVASAIPNSNNPHKFADTAIPILIKKMEAGGALRAVIKAKIAGGAKLFAAMGNSDITNIGERNIAAVKQTLSALKIAITAEDIGKDFGRTQTFYALTGTMKIKSAIKGEWLL